MHYRIKSGDSLSRIAATHRLSLGQLLALNPQYKPDPDSIRVGEKIRLPAKGGKGSGRKPSVAKKKPAGRGSPQQVSAGQLTFDAEGNDNPNSKYFSRRLHVPGPWSGATIGRGYDMGSRSSEGVSNDLRAAGVSRAQASRLAACAGLRGDNAKAFIRGQGLNRETISRPQQKALFISTYAELEADVKRICNKTRVVEKYGPTHWQDLHPKVRDIVIDLRYRGDYTPATRERLQPALVANDLARLAEIMRDRDYWELWGVPADRFRRRRDYLA